MRVFFNFCTLSFICIVSISGVFGQGKSTNYSQSWKREIGPGVSDTRGVIHTSEGGVVVAANAIFDSQNGEDALVIKYGPNGDIIWQSRFGGIAYDNIYCIVKTQDGGFIVAGTQRAEGNYDGKGWIVKLDQEGEVVWEVTPPISDFGYANAIVPTHDGNFVLVGVNKTEKGQNRDAWILKVDSKGQKLWDKSFGGRGEDHAQGVLKTEDNGFIVVGHTSSKGEGNDDVWVTKFNEQGALLWEKTYGGTESDYAFSVAITSQGDYVLAGGTHSFGSGEGDIWVIKIDGNGNKIWDKAFGSPGNEGGHAITSDTNDTITIAGWKGTSNPNQENAWLINIDLDGNTLWEEEIPDENMSNHPISMIHTANGDLVVVTISRDRQKDLKKGWVFKLDN